MSFGLPGNQLTKSTNIHSWWDTAKIEEIESFKSQCNSLTLKILSCFATHMDLPGGFFDASHRQVLPGNTLKFIKYPKMTTKPDVIPRLSEHTDWGSLTLLFTESPGLEVRDPNNQWHDVPVVPGGVIINIGDALSLWTGKQLKSTMHRISWEKVPMHQDRYSMPYFVHPNFSMYHVPCLGTRYLLTFVAANLRSLSAPYDSDATQLTYKDYFDVRLRLTYGSLKRLSYNNPYLMIRALGRNRRAHQLRRNNHPPAGHHRRPASLEQPDLNMGQRNAHPGRVRRESWEHDNAVD